MSSCDELEGPAKVKCTANYYELFGVKRPRKRTKEAVAALKQELKQQRKRVLLTLHPDKNRDPRAPMAFDKAQDAYEVLAQVGVLPPPATGPFELVNVLCNKSSAGASSAKYPITCFVFSLAGFQGSKPAATGEPRRVVGVARPHPTAGAVADSPNVAPPLAPQRQMGSNTRQTQRARGDARAESSNAVGPAEDHRQCSRTVASGVLSHMPYAAYNTTSAATTPWPQAPTSPATSQPTAAILGWGKSPRPTTAAAAAAAATTTIWRFSKQGRTCCYTTAEAAPRANTSSTRRAAGLATTTATGRARSSTADGCVGTVPARAAEKQAVGMGAITIARGISGRNQWCGALVYKRCQPKLILLWWWGLLAWAAIYGGGVHGGGSFLLPGAEAVGFTIQFGGNHRRGGSPGDDSDDEQRPPSPVHELYSEERGRGLGQQQRRPLELTNGEVATNRDGSGLLQPPQPSFGVPGMPGDSSGSGASSGGVSSSSSSSSTFGVALGPADPTSAWFYAWQTTCAWAAETFVRPVRKVSARTTGKRGFFSRKVSSVERMRETFDQFERRLHYCLLLFFLFFFLTSTWVVFSLPCAFLTPSYLA